MMVALAAASPASPHAWAAPAPGVEHLHIDEGNVDLFRFDLTLFRADVAVPGAGGPITAGELRRETGAELVVNGGLFDTDGRPLGLRIVSGRKLIKLRGVVGVDPDARIVAMLGARSDFARGNGVATEQYALTETSRNRSLN